MSSPLPPDPYKVLGVLKDAKLPDIRSAHRKLVLKCHPDKVQDAALKAVKQDEFQKVQQAYELLSDDNRRLQYDEQVKLFELRKEMGRNGPTARSNPFEYEIRTAEPRPSTYKSKPRESAKVYAQPPPKSYEDDLSRLYEDTPRATARKSASYEERKRPSPREEEKRRKDDDRERERWEKESKRAGHGERKKTRDKERKKGTEEKYTRTTAAYIEDDSEDEYRAPPRSDKKSSRKIEEEIRQREEAARAAEKANREEESERTRKLNTHKDFAAQYMQATRRKVERIEDDFQPRPVRRAETFQAPSYNIRYATPDFESDDNESPRHSSGRTSTRRPSDTPPSRTRDSPKSSAKERRSPGAHPRDPYIVEPPSPPPTIKKPTLQSHTSAPPTLPTFSSVRKEPIRSKTMQSEHARKDFGVSPPPRASTFQAGDRGGRGGSRLKQSVEYESEPDSPVYVAPRSSTPPRRREPEEIRYVIEKGRSVPISRHRSELREDYANPRDRSESPHGGRHSGFRQASSYSHSQGYYPPDSSEPVVIPGRPKMPPRDSSHRSTSSRGPPYFSEVKYAPAYGPEHVVYTPDPCRRGSDPSHHRDYSSPSHRGGRGEVYA